MSEIIQTGADGMDGRIDRLSIKADRSGIAVYIPECMYRISVLSYTKRY